MNKQRIAEGLKRMQWDMNVMLTLTPEQRRTIDAAAATFSENTMLEALRPFLAFDHPLA
ncbi:MAG TPA: hypothetical protein VGX91_03910 [Candidatus Cybelea sp.]|jgi:Spy/CpxP family protein refolding chaperone|nr:hypothetical protein [Candidatus Cybelea sp.]